jgi:hypothetical protein
MHARMQLRFTFPHDSQQPTLALLLNAPLPHLAAAAGSHPAGAMLAVILLPEHFHAAHLPLKHTHPQHSCNPWLLMLHTRATPTLALLLDASVPRLAAAAAKGVQPATAPLPHGRELPTHHTRQPLQQLLWRGLLHAIITCTQQQQSGRKLSGHTYLEIVGGENWGHPMTRDICSMYSFNNGCCAPSPATVVDPIFSRHPYTQGSRR